MVPDDAPAAQAVGRAPYGARGLKCYTVHLGHPDKYRRAPYGARGLKCADSPGFRLYQGSRPVWGAWIEILPF